MKENIKSMYKYYNAKLKRYTASYDRLTLATENLIELGSDKELINAIKDMTQHLSDKITRITNFLAIIDSKFNKKKLPKQKNFSY